MINEKRVRHMARMAIYEKEEGRDLDPVADLSLKDYLSYGAVTAFVRGSIGYGIVFVGIVCAVFSVMELNLTPLNITIVAVSGVSGYLLFLVIYLRIARFRGINRYRKSRKVIEHMRRDWRRLEELYEEEERRKSPKLKEVFNEKIFDEESAFGEPSGE